MAGIGTRRHRILLAYARSMGWELPSLDDTDFEGDTTKATSILATHLPNVTDAEKARAISVSFGLETASDPAWEFTDHWPENCRTLDDLVALEPSALALLGVGTLAQRLTLRRLVGVPTPSENPSAPPLDTSAEKVSTLAERLQARRVQAGSVPSVPVDRALSDARWPSAPALQAARASALVAPAPWPVGGAVVGAMCVLYLVVPSFADASWYWLFGVGAIALFVANKFGAAQRTAMVLVTAVVLNYVLSMLGTPGTPVYALVSGVAACLFGGTSAVWIAFRAPPDALLRPHDRLHVPTAKELGTTFQAPMLLTLMERKQLSEAELPELSDKALYDAGFTTTERRDQVREAMRPVRVQDPAPMWKHHWQTSAVVLFALVSMLVGTVSAVLEQGRLHDEELERQSQLQTEYAMQQAASAQEAASNARAARSMAAQSRRAQDDAMCTYMCNSEGGCGMLNQIHYGTIRNAKCNNSPGYAWVCTNGPCR